MMTLVDSSQGLEQTIQDLISKKPRITFRELMLMLESRGAGEI